MSSLFATKTFPFIFPHTLEHRVRNELQRINAMPDESEYVAERWPHLQHFHNGLASIKLILKNGGWMNLLCVRHYPLVTGFYELIT